MCEDAPQAEPGATRSMWRAAMSSRRSDSQSI
jgi:hypothetical protein